MTNSSACGQESGSFTAVRLAVRHHFPLDAEYVIKVDLSRNLDGGQIRGVHEMEVRLDRALVKRITIDASKGGGSGKAPVEVRMPVKAGQRLLSVSFVGSIDQLLPRDGRPAPSDLKANDVAHWQITMTATGIERLLRPTRLFHLVSPDVTAVDADRAGFSRGLLVRDPDGHGVRLVS